MQKKLLAALLTLCMVLSFAPINVFATTVDGTTTGSDPVDTASTTNEEGGIEVATVNDVVYATLAEALDAAEAGDTITLLADVDILPTIDKAITIDGNNHRVAGADDDQFGTISGTVTLKNLIYSNGTEAIRTNYSSTDYSGMTLVVEDCVFNDVNRWAILGGSTGTNPHKVLGGLTVTDCTFNAGEACDNYMVYAQCVKELTVTGCTFNGGEVTKGAIHTGDSQTVSVNATISGNTINDVKRAVVIANRAEGTAVSVTNNAFDGVTTGAVYIHEIANTNTAVSVTDNTATDTAAVVYSDDNASIASIVTEVSGNTNDGTAVEISFGEDGTVTEEAVDVSCVATVDGVGYESLAGAIAAANAGQIVEIAAGELGLDEIFTIDKAITIKGAGETATKLVFDTASSAFTVASSGVTFSDMTIVQGVQDNSFHISISKGAWNAPAVQYSDITIKNITFIGGDYALCLIGEDVVVDSCTFDNQDSHNIIIYSVRGDSKITNNVFNASLGNNKSAILYEGGADNATDLSGFIGGGTLTISGNEANAKGVFFQFTNWGLVEGMNVSITNNEIDAFTNKAIAIYDMDGALTANGDEFASFVVSENVFTNVPSGRPIVKEYTGTVTVDASANYLGSDTPDVDTLIVGDGVVVNSYYSDEELAELVSLVSYVAEVDGVKYESLQEALNAAAAGTGNVTVEILDDINLTGIDWTTVTVSAPGYPKVTVNGNGKTITGLNDMLFAGTWAGGSGLIINDLTIANSTIVHDENDAAGNIGVGAFIGFPQASATITLNNCHLVDSTVKGGHWTGGLIGYAAGYAGTDGPVFMNLTIENCSVTGSTITGKGSVGGIIGHATGNAWTDVAIETTTVSGNTVTSTGSSTNKAGAVVGTIGAAGQTTTVNGVEHTGGVSVSATVSGNTVTSNGTTITTVYGRQGTNTGMLEIAGGSYDSNPIEENVSYAAPTEGYVIEENADGTYGVAVDPAYGKVAKIGDNYYETLADAVAAAQSGDTIVLMNGEYELPLFSGKELTFKGESKEGVIINDAPDARTQGWNGSTFHFENLTAKGATANYHGLANGVVAVTYKGCDINGLRFLYATDEVSFDNCAFNANGVEHSFWTYGASKVTVTNCDFTYTDRAVNCYSENGANHELDISFSGCTFTYAGDAESPEGAVEINSGSVKSIDLTMDDCTAPAEGAMWFNSQWDNTGGVNTEVTVDDEKVWPITYVAEVDGVGYEDLQDAIVAAAPNGTVEILADVTVDEWVMIAESLTIGNGNLITCVIDGMTIDGNGHTLTINSIESAGNGGYLFFDATELNVNNLTIKYADGLAGAICLKAGTLDNVTFDGCVYGVIPQSGDVVIQNCTFKTTGTSIYFEEERDGLTVTGCTFENADSVNVILLRGDVEFTNNTVVSGRTVNVVSGSPVVTGNNFNDVRLKVYNDAAATISNNEINVLVFNDETAVQNSTFSNNTMSEDAQAALDAAIALSVIEIYDWDDLKALDARVEGGDMLEGFTVKLMNDIDLYAMGEDGEPVSFNPIGANTAYFKGTFDGQGHTIKNMYQNGWALGYDWYNYGSIGLFAYLWNATVKNLTIENAECLVEGGNVAGIAGCAWGDCTFENITIKNSTYATYNNRAAGIVGYTGGQGTMTFKNVTVDEDTVIAALWGSYDCTLGGVVGSTQSPTKYAFEDVTVECKLDCYNDVTASYKWYSYRMCGMLIGRMGTLQEDNPTEVDPRDVVTINNVNITIGEWANQTYIWDDSLSKGCQRVEPGYSYGGVNVEDYPNAEITDLGFNVIIGGPQSQSTGYYGSDITDLEELEGFEDQVAGLEVEDIALEIRSRVAQVDDAEGNVEYYTDLQAAIDAANEGATVTLLKDVTLTETLTIAADKAVVLDLNGKTVSMEDASAATVCAIKNNGDLTIKDSVGGGKITFNSTTPSANNAYASNTISNYGTITVESGIIENTTVGGACYALDNYAGSTATINGGTLTAEKTTVRIFNWTNGDAAKATLNVNGGEIISEDGYAINVNSGNAPAVAINVTGGTITTNDTDYNLAVYIVNSGSAENLIVNVTGGTFDGNFALNGVTATTMGKDAVSISGGTFDGVICYADPAYGFISGGTYADASVIDYLADGYELKVSVVDGKVVYGVQISAAAYVASVNGVDYTSLQAAVDAIATSGTIYIKNDANISDTVTIPAGKTITLELNGKTISQSKACTASYSMIENRGTLIVSDSVGTGKISFTDTSEGDPNFGWGSYTVYNYGTLVVEGGTIEHLGAQAFATHMICAIQQYSGSTTVNGGTVSTPNYRSVRINGGTLTVNGGELDGQVWVQPFADGISVTVNGGTFEPNGRDASSIFVGNETKEVELSVVGGVFNGKIGCSNADTLAGAIENGIFTESAKANTNAALLKVGYQFATEVNADGYYDVERDPLSIATLYELEAFRNKVNAGDNYSNSKPVYLIADIDLAGEEWTPIGKSDSTPFNGTFDGRGYTISNLVISGYNSNVGLFGFTTNGEIKNLTVENASVSGRLNVGVVAGTPYTSKYTNVTVTGHVEVNGMAYVGGVGGKNAYADWTDVTVDVDDTSYVNANSVENGVAYRTYVGGVIGFIGEGGHTFKNISSNINVIGSTCDIGGITGIAHYGNNFENVICSGDVSSTGEADEIGGIAGVWHNAAGQTVTMTDCEFTGTVSDVNGAVADCDIVGGAYNASNYTAENSGSLIIDGVEAWLKTVAVISGETTVNYLTLAEAAAAAVAGDEIKLLADVTLAEALTLPAGITLNGNGFAINGTITAGGNLTIAGYTKVTTFNAGYNKPTITIGEGATLETTSGRVVIGHGATFNITGSIVDAKTADIAELTPSLIVPGASFTGAGVNFNVTNAYIKFTAYASSKNNNASSTFNLNVTNSIWEQSGSLVFSEPTNGMDPTFNFYLTDSVLNSTSHLVFAVTKGEIVIDNSNVNVDVYRQLENRSTLTIKNGSVVYASVQTSQNAVNPGTTIVDNATYVTIGTFGGAKVGTGALVLKNDATFTTDSLANVDVTVDATSLLTATKSADMTNTTVTVDGSALATGTSAKVIDLSGSASIESIVTVIGNGVSATFGDDGDVTVAKRNIGGQIAYRAYVNDSDSRESISVDLLDVFAENSLVIKLIDASGSVLTETTLKRGGVEADSYSANIVLWGTASGSWDTVIKADKLTMANVPATIELYCDGVLADTFENALGAGTNVDETAEYVALDCVYKEASVTDTEGNVTYYATFTEAIAAANDGDTVTLLTDIEADDIIFIDKSITINGNGHKVVSNATRVFRITASNAEITLNDVNMVSGAVMVYPNDIRGISVDAALSNVKLTLNNCSVDFTDASACDWAYAVNVSGNGTGHTLTVDGGSYEGANVINVHGANNTVTVKNATLTSLYPSNGSFGACIWVLQNNNSSVTATGNTFNGDNAIAFNLGTGTALEESNNTDNTKRVVAIINDTYYNDLAEAFAAAGEGDTIKLIANVALTNTIKVEADDKIILDLNGKTIDIIGNSRIAIMTYGDLTVMDSSAEKTGTIKAGKPYDNGNPGGNTINVCGGTFTLESGNIYSQNNGILIDEEAATVNIKDGKIIAEPTTDNSAAFYISSTSNTVLNIEGGEMVGYNGILLWNNTEINITGGTINAEGRLAIQGNGSKDNTEINISGDAVITGKEAVIYHPQGGELNISGGTLTGETGIVVKGGNVTISGGTINATGEASAYDPKSSGFNPTGDALYVEHYDNSTNSENYGTPTVKVTGGTFNSVNAKPIANYANTNNAVEPIDGFVTGGTFNKAIDEDVCAEGYIPTENSDGTYGVKIGKYVAQAGDVKFESLADALAAVKSGDTVTLLADVTVSEKWDCRYNGAKVTVPVTIDGNDHTLKLTGEVSDGNNWSTVFRFEDVATVKNLTIDVSEATGVQRGISSKLSLTVENCKLIGNGTTSKRAIIFGEGAGAAISDITLTVTDSKFVNWTLGVSDNQSGKDAKSVTITDNTFVNADVLVSASEAVVFNDNIMSDAWVNISSYSVPNELDVTATGNVLAANTEDEYNQIVAAVINAQDGFLTPVAANGGVLYITLEKAIENASDGDTVTLIADVTLDEALVIDKSLTLVLDGNAINGTIELAVEEVTLTAAEGLDVTTSVEGGSVVYENGVYSVSSVHSHTEEEIPAVAATCTETGLTAGVKCSVCGEVLVAQEVVPALGHNYSTATATNCSACDHYRAVFSVETLSATAETLLTLKFFLPSEVINSDGAYIVGEQNGEETEYVIADLTVDTSNRYCLEIGIPSGRMTMPVTATIYDGNGNAVEIYDNQRGVNGTSVSRAAVDYAKRMLAGTSDAYISTHSLMIAISTYGGYAQRYFARQGMNVDVSNPAFNILPEYGKQIPDISTITAVSIPDMYAAPVNGDISGIGINYDAQSPGLESSVYLNVFFTLESGYSINDFKFELTYPKDGRMVTEEVETTYDSSKNRYCVKITDIPVAYWDNLYTITITNLSTEAEYEVNTCIVSYVKYALDKFTGANNAELCDLLKAMYFYSTEATKYFGK